MLDPSMLRGIALGVVFSIILILIFQLDNILLVLSLVIAGLVILLIGVLIGNYLYNSSRQKLEESFEEKKIKVNSSTYELVVLLQAIRFSKEDNKHIIEKIINESNIGCFYLKIS